MRLTFNEQNYNFVFLSEYCTIILDHKNGRFILLLYSNEPVVIKMDGHADIYLFKYYLVICSDLSEQVG